MFFYEVEGHMQKLSSFGRGKTIHPKKSLTRLLHEALQLYDMAFESAKPKSRLLPKKKNREPFGLLILQVGSPSHTVGSPHKKYIII